MYLVDLYLTVRLACHVEELSQREAARRFGLSRDTVKKMLRHSVPPGYRRSEPPKRPKLDPFTDIIDRILEADRTVHRKQRHTAKRIFERLRDEHGFTGGQTIVKDYVRERRRRLREMFVPLVHPPGHAPGHVQADFGESDAIIAGVKLRAHFFVMTLPHSAACFVVAYPAATVEACQKGLAVGFTTAAALVHELMEARDEKRLLRLQKQLAKVRLLIIDELGFVPLSKTGAELLFEVFSQRYERGAIVITSNLPFDEWTEIFGSERLTGALLDRLTHHVHILEMNGDSYRLNQSRRKQQTAGRS